METEQSTRPPTRAERSRQILAVLAKHGLSAAGTGLTSHDNRSEATAREVRLACEELGTTFIKFAQLLSARSDLLPPEYRDELAKLQDDVPPVEPARIEAVFVDEFGLRPQEMFEYFDEVPAASASIGQVHDARLGDGRAVAVKVRKPGVREIVERDLEILRSLSGIAERLFPATAGYDLDGLLQEFDDTIHDELNYTREARNIETFAGFFSDETGFELPEVVGKLSTSQVLTMTRVEGSRVDDIGRMTARRRTAAAGRVARFVLEPALVHGVFHADPHEGNVLVRRDGTIAVLDFGMVGRLNDELRRGLGDMFWAMQRQDSRRLTDRLVQLAPPSRPIDRSLLMQRLQRLLERYFGDSAEQLHMGAALREIMELIRTYGLRSPSSLALLFKAVALADGTILTLTPDKPLTDYLEPIAKRVNLARLSASDWSERARLSAMDVAELSLELPRHADRVLTDLELGNLRVWARIEGAESMLKRVEHMVEHANATMIAAACVIGITVLFAVYRPPWWQAAVAWAFWIALSIAVAVTVRTGLRVLFHRRTRR